MGKLSSTGELEAIEKYLRGTMLQMAWLTSETHEKPS
jgi:hypothetical protein